jgi:hypothetical protein
LEYVRASVRDRFDVDLGTVETRALFGRATLLPETQSHRTPGNCNREAARFQREKRAYVDSRSKFIHRLGDYAVEYAVRAD